MKASANVNNKWATQQALWHLFQFAMPTVSHTLATAFQQCKYWTFTCTSNPTLIIKLQAHSHHHNNCTKHDQVVQFWMLSQFSDKTICPAITEQENSVLSAINFCKRWPLSVLQMTAIAPHGTYTSPFLPLQIAPLYIPVLSFPVSMHIAFGHCTINM